MKKVFVCFMAVFLCLNLFSPALAGALTGSNAPPVINAACNNNKNYEWYKSQYNTGTAWGNNCGPTSVWMAMMYQKNIGVPSVEDIRNFRMNNGGWWYVNDIRGALQNWGYKASERQLSGIDQTKQELLSLLKAGNIAIVCLNMSKITYATDGNSRYNTYYKNVTGHFIVIKGVLDDGEWFVVYDPWSLPGHNYADGTPMGKERYYSIQEVCSSMCGWDRSYMEVEGTAPDALDFKIDTRFNVQKLVPSQMITAVVTADNVSKTSYAGKKDVLVIVALYNRNNTMENISYVSKGIPYLGTEKLSAGFKLPSDIAGYAVKAMVWDGVDLRTSDMLPLSNEVHL